jgi:hypothetical protein
VPQVLLGYKPSTINESLSFHPNLSMFRAALLHADK